MNDATRSFIIEGYDFHLDLSSSCLKSYIKHQEDSAVGVHPKNLIPTKCRSNLLNKQNRNAFPFWPLRLNSNRVAILVHQLTALPRLMKCADYRSRVDIRSKILVKMSLFVLAILHFKAKPQELLDQMIDFSPAQEKVFLLSSSMEVRHPATVALFFCDLIEETSPVGLKGRGEPLQGCKLCRNLGSLCKEQFLSPKQCIWTRQLLVALVTWTVAEPLLWHA